MLKQLENILKNFNEKIKSVKNPTELEEVKKVYAGKESPLNEVLKSMKSAAVEEKKAVGVKANEVKTHIFGHINSLNEKFKHEELKKQLENEKVDLSMPGLNLKMGSKHPLNLVIEEISDIFTELGFDMVAGTEYETDDFCFQKLNLPIGHPARDMQDTFYIDNNTVLRTHCTNMTARMLTDLSKLGAKEKNLAAISFGNVYRRDDDDATHSHQFMQIDGFAVGKKISFANLKWILEYMCKRLFSENTEIRMRPSYFPFTEPSVEVDITCITCQGKGCKICKFTGWIEILGSGLIAPEVIELNGLDPKEVGGLAFGIGVERVAMLKYGIKNIRDFYENDIKFLNQFKFFGN
ncbi:phenylalanyl-tRNA synthetase subunit alpha [Spiroplasma chinense]|uniref:Phenylalanine--tRNA ligase alpha subunit n=1 Tax=Spiroplasma chinense TaxID=216932 RepID=A0A5B9Y4Y9_9MOLU|nr:phenylalanine--tRNA ligase subunit alpha [Spiroplasma chinense]QEH62111.1 phenylalanyl-tRNA synthetase subunit alpha [Spiroplasma chinense]